MFKMITDLVHGWFSKDGLSELPYKVEPKKKKRKARVSLTAEQRNNMTEQEFLKDELRQSLLQVAHEARAEAAYEKRLYEDVNFAIEVMSPEIMEAYDELVRISKVLSDYGHDGISAKELLEYI